MEEPGEVDPDRLRQVRDRPRQCGVRKRYVEAIVGAKRHLKRARPDVEVLFDVGVKGNVSHDAVGELMSVEVVWGTSRPRPPDTHDKNDLARRVPGTAPPAARRRATRSLQKRLPDRAGTLASTTAWAHEERCLLHGAPRAVSRSGYSAANRTRRAHTVRAPSACA